MSSVTATDINGCTIATSITLTEPTPLDEDISAFTYPSGDNISCNGESDGSIELAITGGSAGYTYAWTGPNGFTSTDEDPTGLEAGTYNVTATDINGCTIASSITLTEPTVLDEDISAFTYASGDNISCNGESDGSIDVEITGGSAGYTYAWTGPNAFTSTDEDPTGLEAGTYNVTATDINGCTISTPITLTEPTVLDEDISAFTYTSGDNISCNGESDGSIELEITGGSAGYTYDWTGPNGFTSTDEDPTGLEAGTYNVTATDVNGCTIATSIVLVEPTPLDEDISAFTYTSGDNISCNGESDGSIELEITGGSAGYTYDWTGPNGFTSTDEDPTGLEAGTYNVTATDINGCTIATSITLTEPTPLDEDISAFTYTSGDNISCNGESDGSIELEITGGSAGYTYDWTGPNGFTSTDEDPTGLEAGTYNVTATDVNGCTIATSIVLIEPDPLVVEADVTSNYNGQDVSCSGASDAEVTIQISGGSPDYNVAIGANQYQISGNSTLDNLGAGAFNIYIKDQNGCEAVSTVVINEPSPVVADVDVLSNYNGMPVSCESNSDGIISASATGGTQPYNYEWNNDPSLNSSLLDSVGVGFYSVTVTDANGCSTIDTVTLDGHPNPTFQTSEPPRICEGEEAFFTFYSNDDITNCSWTFETGEVFTSCNDYSYNFNTTGCIDATIQVTSSNGCTTESNLPDFVCIDPNPVADFYTTDSDLTTLNPTVHFWNESTNASNYDWDLVMDNLVMWKTQFILFQIVKPEIIL